MSTPLFLSLNSAAIASEIQAAQHSVCYAAPEARLPRPQAQSSVPWSGLQMVPGLT